MADLTTSSGRQSSNTLPILIAVLVLAGIAAVIFYFNPHRIADLKVTGVDTFAPHTTFEALEGANPTPGTHVLGQPTTSAENDLYLFARVSMTDRLRLPLFVSGITAQVTLQDGSEEELTMLTVGDLKRLAVIFPAIKDHVSDPIGDGEEITPGQTRTGTVAFQLPGRTVADWANKKAGVLTVELRNQEPQTTRLP